MKKYSTLKRLFGAFLISSSLFAGYAAEAAPVIGESDLFSFTFNNEGTVNGSDRPIQAANWDGVYTSAALPLATGPAAFADLSEGVSNDLTPGTYKAGFLFVSGKNGQAAPEGFFVFSTNTNVVDVEQWPQFGPVTVNPQTDWYSAPPNGVSDLSGLKVSDLQTLTMRIRPRNGETVRFHFAIKIDGQWLVSQTAFTYPSGETEWYPVTLTIPTATWLADVVSPGSLNLDFNALAPSTISTAQLNPNLGLDSVGIYIDTDDNTGQTDTWARVDSIALEVVYAPFSGPPTIRENPVNVEFADGGTIQFSVDAVGEAPLSYQWQFEGQPIQEEGNASTLTISPANPWDAGSYNVVVTNAKGSETSSFATATFLGKVFAPTVIRDPLSFTETVGNPFSLSVGVTGTPPFTYQWRRNGVNISGATRAKLVVSNAAIGDSGSYDVIVSNPRGQATSKVAVVKIVPYATPPRILEAPSLFIDAPLGMALTLKVVATGSTPLSYQWYKNGEELLGAVLDELTYNATTIQTAGTYRVVVSNSAGSASSQNILVRVFDRPVLTPGELNVNADAQGAAIQVVQSTGANWSVQSKAPWVEVLTPNGLGTATVHLSIEANSSVMARTGTVVIGGVSLMVNQAGYIAPTTFDEVVKGVDDGSGLFVSPWFGKYTPADNDWIEHESLGWLYTGYATSSSSLYFYSLGLNSWIWTSQGYFPSLYDFANDRWVIFLSYDDKGFIFDYTTWQWIELNP